MESMPERPTDAVICRLMTYRARVRFPCDGGGGGRQAFRGGVCFQAPLAITERLSGQAHLLMGRGTETRRVLVVGAFILNPDPVLRRFGAFFEECIKGRPHALFALPIAGGGRFRIFGGAGFKEVGVFNA